MKIEERILLFKDLGVSLRNDLDKNLSEEIFQLAKNKNPWFTLDNIKAAIYSITENYLDDKELNDFVKKTEITEPKNAKKIGIVAAGNIPLVCFQDVLHVILCGHVAFIKPSSQDEVLLKYIYNSLLKINPKTATYFNIVDRLNEADAYIATGSDNSARYFEYYFSSKPNIIRQNRSSVAVLTGQESVPELRNLANDLFTYFGLGCRNVSKVFVPESYDFTTFFESIEYWNTLNLHTKYFNNYEYMKSIYLVNRDVFLDNGFLLVKEDEKLVSPISVLFFSYYSSKNEVNEFLEANKNKIQTVISNSFEYDGKQNFGESQQPKIDSYADGIDTVKFLLSLK